MILVRMKRKSNQCPSRMHVFLSLSLFLLLLASGCFRLSGAADMPQPELIDYLPADWLIADKSQRISIDGDDEEEFLILYTYDGAPVGSVIYDFQDSTSFVTPDVEPIPIPNQPSVLYVPYRLLPSYLPGTGQGFIASPGTLANLEIYQVNRTTEPELREDGTAIPDELIVYDGVRRITFVWWRDFYHGYGLTHVDVPGRLFGFTYREGEGADTSPPLAFQGHVPLNDRSLFCYQIRFVRTDGSLFPVPDIPDDKAIHYQHIPEGLRFCNGTPTFPFFPEGVVLAFLLNPTASSSVFDEALPQAERERIVQLFLQLLSDGTGNLRVDEVIGQKMTEFADSQNGRRDLLDLHACAKVIGTMGAEAFYFTLRHAPQNLTQRTTDRLYITRVDPIPAPQGMSNVNCHEVVQRRS